MFNYNNIGHTGKYLFNGHNENISILNNGFISPRGYNCNIKKNTNLKIKTSGLNNIYNDIYKTFYNGYCNFTIFKKAVTPLIKLSSEVYILFI